VREEATPAAGMNLNQVTLHSSDIARSIEFYRRLGLKLIVEALPRYARFECPDGDSTFSVEKRHGDGSPSPNSENPPRGRGVFRMRRSGCSRCGPAAAWRPIRLRPHNSALALA